MTLREFQHIEQSQLPVVMIFSPDIDVARSLSMFLEDRFTAVYETRLELLGQRVATVRPDVLIVDLYPTLADTIRIVEYLRECRGGSAVVALHVHRHWMPAIEQRIREVADVVLYKPIKIDAVATLLEELISEKRGSLAQEVNHENRD